MSATIDALRRVKTELKEIRTLLNDVDKGASGLSSTVRGDSKTGGGGGRGSSDRALGTAPVSVPTAQSAFNANGGGNAGYATPANYSGMAPPSMPTGGSGMTAGSAAVRAGSAVGGAIIGMMPEVSGAVDMQQALFQASFYSGGPMGRQDFNRMSQSLQRLFYNSQTSIGSAQRSAAIAASMGFNPMQADGRGILGQVGNISRSTGMSNEQVTGILSSQSTNAVMTNRLRGLGFEMFDSSGNPKDVSQIAKHIVKVVYGMNPRPEQIQKGLRPGGALDLMLQSYIPDPGMQQLVKDAMFKQALGNQSGLSDSNLNPRNAGMRYASSESRKTNSTRDSSVAGYTTGLDVGSNLNDAFTTLAEDAGILSSAFQGLAATMGFANGFGSTTPGQVLLNSINSIPVIGPIISGIFGALAHASGGPIKGPGGPTDDKIPALLSNGEYVINAKSVEKYGKGLFEALNAQKYSEGGPVTISGHPALQAGDPRLGTFGVAGGRNITVADWAAPLFQQFLQMWQDDPNLGKGRLSLNSGPLDSYEYRKARAADGLSDHAGYAVDIRYDILSADGKRHMKPEESSAVRRILGSMGGKLSWGGEYGAGNVDEMHVYVSKGVDGPATYRDVTGPTGSSTPSSSQNLGTGSPAMVVSTPLYNGVSLSSNVSGLKGSDSSVVSAITTGPVYAPLGVQQSNTNSLAGGATSSDPGSTGTTGNYGSGTLSGKSLVKLLHDTGFTGQDLRTAYGVVMGESGGNPSAKHFNPDNKSTDWGLFQINDYWNKKVGGETVDFGSRILDASYNSRIGMMLKQQGGWDLWSAYKSGSQQYQKGLTDYDQHPDWYQGYSKGAWRVENDQLAKIHQNEMILPAPAAEAVRTVLREGTSGASSSGKRNEVTINLTVAKATDEEAVRLARKVKRMLDDDRVLTSLASGY